MLKYHSYDIVCQEIPDEITIAVYITGCPNRCHGCHSPWLWEDTGDIIDEVFIDSVMEKYGNAATCFCFMGGDGDVFEIQRLASCIKKQYPAIKTAWYSGRDFIPDGFGIELFDYIKTGRYDESLGGLKSVNTNQRLYRICKKSEGLNLEIIQMNLR